MSARIGKLPDGYMVCSWCKHGIRLTPEGNPPTRCPRCGLHPDNSAASKTRTSTKTESTSTRTPAKKTTSSTRKTAPRRKPLSDETSGQLVLGVDPGARYTGIVIRDGDVPVYSTTLVRDKDEDAGPWARQVVQFLKDLQEEWGDLPMGVEGVSDPKGFKGGERASLNPGHIMRAAVVFGAVAAVWPEAVIIPPGGNGSQHESHYPAALKGRRPKDLPGTNTGAGTRAHEQSAYDVAGKAAKEHYPAKPLDLTG